MNGYHFRLGYDLVGSSNGMVGLGAFPTYVTCAGTPRGGAFSEVTEASDLFAAKSEASDRDV